MKKRVIRSVKKVAAALAIIFFGAGLTAAIFGFGVDWMVLSAIAILMCAVAA